MEEDQIPCGDDVSTVPLGLLFSQMISCQWSVLGRIVISRDISTACDPLEFHRTKTR